MNKTVARKQRLEYLCSKKETDLTRSQKEEKQLIIKLERNRKAAATSRAKKKIYISNLEQQVKQMEKTILSLEMENSHLKTILVANKIQIPWFGSFLPPPPPLPPTEDMQQMDMDNEHLYPPPLPFHSSCY